MTWKVDVVHSKIGFSVKHFKFMTVQGRVESFGGTLVIDDEDHSASPHDVDRWHQMCSYTYSFQRASVSFTIVYS